MKINVPSPTNILMYADIGCTPLFGGWSECKPYFIPELAAQGITLNSCSVTHVWKNAAGQSIFITERSVGLNEVSGYAEGDNSQINWWPNPAQFGICTLWFVVKLLVTLPDNSQGLNTYTINTGYTNASAPDQVVANEPSGQPLNAGSSSSFYCSVDTNGTNTRYEAEFQSADGSGIVIGCGLQASNCFSGNFSNVMNANGQVRWRARAVNDQGTGDWSDWTTFQYFQSVSGSCSCFAEPDSSKTHMVVASLNITSGHTLDTATYMLYKLVNGSWVYQEGHTTTAYGAYFTDLSAPSGTQYKVTINGTASKFGINSSFSFIGFCEFVGEA